MLPNEFVAQSLAHCLISPLPATSSNVENERHVLSYFTQAYHMDAWTVYRLARAAMRQARYRLAQHLFAAIDEHVLSKRVHGHTPLVPIMYSITYGMRTMASRVCRGVRG
jgi:hypothetical protein